jgi:hypothetical protein
VIKRMHLPFELSPHNINLKFLKTLLSKYLANDLLFKHKIQNTFLKIKYTTFFKITKYAIDLRNCLTSSYRNILKKHLLIFCRATPIE